MTNKLPSFISAYHSGIMRKISKKFCENEDGFNLLKETFIKQQYRWLITDLNPDTVIIDIGANIGDTAIYFAQFPNIKLVMAYEPYPRIFEKANQNISSSGLSNKINLLNAGVSDKNKTVHVTRNLTTPSSKLTELHGGMNIPIYSLKEVINMAPKCKEILIKSDCEGGEYDIFLHSNPKILKAVKKIMLEYHPDLINNKLTLSKYFSGCGYRVYMEDSATSGYGLMKCVRFNA